MNRQETCVDCGRRSPQAHTDNTLTTSLGWRISRRMTESGQHVTEWRCPPCWAKYKAKYMAGAIATPPAARRKPE